MANRGTVARVIRGWAVAEASALTDRDLLARFAADRDQAAFAAVAARHAAMVLGVYRRALPPPHDPEDACQAVFLLLARKAAGGRWQASVANWLHATARKVAANARVAAARRTRRERRAAVPEASPPADPMTARELTAALDEELGRLPPRYREPLVLCYLEGLTRDEAAARLGVRPATLKSRLQRGREKLAAALAARGCAPGTALLAAVASGATASPPGLVAAAASAANGFPSAAADALAREVAVNAIRGYAKVGLAAVAAVAAAVGTGFALAPPAAVPPPAAAARQPTDGADPPAVSLIGTGKFRAVRPIGDARFSADGKRVVGYAGGTVYVWNAADGILHRTIETGLGKLDDPSELDPKKELAFAVSPKGSRVACGGIRRGEIRLQVWDFETGLPVAESAGGCNGLKALAWTPDGERLLERTNAGEWRKPTALKLLVRDGSLGVLFSIDLPDDPDPRSAAILPLPDGERVVLWQSGRDKEPAVYDLESGRVVRTVPYRPELPCDLGVSPDGKTLAATAVNAIALFDLGSGKRTDLPIHRSGWEKPRPLFSPDGKTVFVWDHRPIAYDAATGKEVWRPTFRTVHTVQMRLCDVSPDGAVVLVRHGRAVAFLDAKTGAELDPARPPATPARVRWSPDGRTLFTRTPNHDRTWTAWDSTTGRRLYDLQPTGIVPGDNWKMSPDLLFLGGGREIAACVEMVESTEAVGLKEFVVFDAVDGRPVRSLAGRLPDGVFRWAHPIGIDPAGTAVLAQKYAVENFARFSDIRYKTTLWDVATRRKRAEWVAEGDRTDRPHHFAPYVAAVGHPDPKEQPGIGAKIRCYSAADGKLIHELRTGYARVEPDRIQGEWLLAEGVGSTWKQEGGTESYVPTPPYGYDLWHLPSGEALRAFDSTTPTPVALGPDGRYVLRARDDRTVEVYEPFVLRRAVAAVRTPCRAERFEFSPDGGRVAVSFADTTVAVWDATIFRAGVEAAVARAVPADLSPLWGDLAGDAAGGLRAARLLAAAGDKAVKLLEEREADRRPPDSARIGQLIADLDAHAYATRERANVELREWSDRTEGHLRGALRAGPSPEAGRRIQQLLDRIDAGLRSAGETRGARAAAALDWMATPAARAVLTKWAAGDPNATLTREAKRRLAPPGRDAQAH